MTSKRISRPTVGFAGQTLWRSCLTRSGTNPADPGWFCSVTIRYQCYRTAGLAQGPTRLVEIPEIAVGGSWLFRSVCIPA